MADQLNWDEIDSMNSKKLKDYAPNGEHTAKLEKVEIKDNENWKSPAIDITWAEDDQYKYPRNKRHWLSIGNRNYRCAHVKGMLIAFGIAEDAAKKAIENAEKDTTRAALVKAYQQVFDRAAQKHPAVPIIVKPQIRNGQPVVSDKGTAYGESDFADSWLAMNDNTTTTTAETVLGAEPVTEDLDVPF